MLVLPSIVLWNAISGGRIGTVVPHCTCSGGDHDGFASSGPVVSWVGIDVGAGMGGGAVPALEGDPITYMSRFEIARLSFRTLSKAIRLKQPRTEPTAGAQKLTAVPITATAINDASQCVFQKLHRCRTESPPVRMRATVTSGSRWFRGDACLIADESPSATFSPCFCQPFMNSKPAVNAALAAATVDAAICPLSRCTPASSLPNRR